jgi:hypothetical protein
MGLEYDADCSCRCAFPPACWPSYETIRLSSSSFLLILPPAAIFTSVLLEKSVRYYMNFSAHRDNIPIMRGLLILCFAVLVCCTQLPYQAHSFNDLDYFIQLLRKGNRVF